MNKGMNGFQLKVLGVVTMVLDHLGEFFLFLGVPMWFHWIGRIAAPIFLFESSEGFIHTSNRKKYMLRLLIGYWLMGVINMVLNRYFAIDNAIVINNIFGTLFLGTVYMQACEYFKQRNFFKGFLWFLVPSLLSVLALLLLSNSGIFASKFGFLFFRVFTLLVPTLMLTEGGVLFVALSVLFYLFHGKKPLQVIALVLVAAITLIFGGGVQHAFTFNYQWMMYLAAIPIILYNGEKGRSMRYFFYIFYPAHIALFAIISFLIQR
ncbi:TraX family protein [Enterococcus pseudoavium]|uniref:TraX family protein n=1 Tax=Enterococcus pseudoavium TaxID=44007 RepID=A0AAE4HZN0_9ENTE|nr:TraX family protein [Enterococcus pseudoavium]MDT2736416.1 TraX family protein [Enterococcus pseudoavium]